MSCHPIDGLGCYPYSENKRTVGPLIQDIQSKCGAHFFGFRACHDTPLNQSGSAFTMSKPAVSVSRDV